MCNERESSFDNESWFVSGVNQFKDSDWVMEVDRFHLNDESLKNNLTSFLKNI